MSGGRGEGKGVDVRTESSQMVSMSLRGPIRPNQYLKMCGTFYVLARQPACLEADHWEPDPIARNQRLLFLNGYWLTFMRPLVEDSWLTSADIMSHILDEERYICS